LGSIDIDARAPGARISALPIALAIAWCALVGGGFVALADVSLAPGRAAGAPHVWPADTALPRELDRPTLVMFVHPHCACTQASLHELDRLMTDVGHGLRAVVVLVREPGLPPGGIAMTDLEALGVSAYDDALGAEASRFDAQTSGTVVVYDAAGQLAFSGGITPARGHQGDSEGRDRILALVHHETAVAGTAPVFGCALHEQTEPGGETE
jgi:hypothetical protein